ncbi:MULTISPECIES: hypothetical protein [Olivibacter]|jgi:hypothetical protein|uniref:DUF1735 domain-containing protein n=1 Tax=Olivibacter oleidegradans TaxID=760123 RepID=A0ABV6HSR6_9SPHI|nr:MULTISPECIES: hypothetical protein [Olivibacter]MDM8174230.1 hypothetical protein [Olivibacter sp. 47]QEL04059.1 hypothetical protein FKG96_25580 [Olivibacter sp. LS-1]
MKKYLFLMIALVGLVGMSGCEKTEVVERAVLPRTFIYTITPDEWGVSENGLNIQTTLPIAELDRYYIEQGNVSVAISEDGETSYDILPSTFNGIAYSVRYSVGQINIYGEDPINNGDFEVPIPNYDVVFKVTLSDADYVE